MYTIFTVGEKEYKLRLNTRNTIELEKKLGGNPLSIFGDGETVPTITNMIYILHASLQAYHHNITIDKAYDIFDSWLAEGHTAIEFLPVITEIYQVSGIIGTGAEEEETEKNS